MPLQNRCCCPLAPGVYAQAPFSAWLGAGYSRGKFGSEIATTVWSVPFTGRYESGPLTLKVSVPWLQITNVGGVIPVLGNGGAEHAASGSEDHGGKGSSNVGGGVGSGGTAGQFGVHLTTARAKKRGRPPGLVRALLPVWVKVRSKD